MIILYSTLPLPSYDVVSSVKCLVNPLYLNKHVLGQGGAVWSNFVIYRTLSNLFIHIKIVRILFSMAVGHSKKKCHNYIFMVKTLMLINFSTVKLEFPY